MDLPPDVNALGSVFRWSDAKDAGLSQPRLRRLLDAGLIERLAHGLYAVARADLSDIDAVEAAAASSKATICLASALARHDLIDEIPSRLHVAVPSDHHIPTTSRSLSWHRFASPTFPVGREVVKVEAGYQLGIFSAERSIVDAYRLRHLYGVEQAREALRSWLSRPNTAPSSLLSIATSFPKATGAIRSDLQVLL